MTRTKGQIDGDGDGLGTDTNQPTRASSGTVRILSEAADAAVTQVKTRRVALHSILPSVPEPRTLAGTLQDRFQFGALLGRGGMGEVQQAHDLGLLREVAVKTCRQAELPDDLRRRFIAEARITAQLEHPNILPVYSLEETRDGDTAFVMRLVEGRDLAAYLDEVRQAYAEGPPEAQYRLETRLDHMLRMCDAMDYAHSRGVLHRDLKPDNVMLAAHGQVCVMDWGLALVMGESKGESSPTSAPVSRHVTGSEARMTSVGDILGTPEYMAPEQAMGETDALGPAADQYALGLILFELVSLRPARGQDTRMEVLAAAQDGLLPPLEHGFGEQIAPGLAKIIERATQCDPVDRYPSVKGLSDDLRRFLRGEAPEVAPDSWPAALWRRLNRRPSVAVATFLGVLTLALAASLLGLYSTLAERRRAAEQAKVISRLTGEVVRHSDAFERQLDEVRLLLEGFARATEQLLRHGKPDPDAVWMTPTSVDRVATTLPSERYGKKVNLDHCVYLMPANARAEEAGSQLARLAPLRSFTKRTYRREADGGVPLLWVYAAFESGLMINYPGHGNYPTGYDPRARPWYRGGKGVRGHHWGAPYRDVSGVTLQMPASHGLFDPRGAFIGMVGIDVNLADMSKSLRLASLPGWKRSFLVDNRAMIIVDTADTAGPEHAPDDTLELKRIPYADVAADIEAQRALGTVRQGDLRVVYTRLDVIPWYVVAVIDERRFRASL